MVGDVGSRENHGAAEHRRTVMVPSSSMAVTTKRSPFLTQPVPVESGRSFRR